MRYFDLINKFRTNVLSASDKQAFVHEIRDNTRLRREAEAVDLMESLLVVGAEGLQESTIFDSTSVSNDLSRFFASVSVMLLFLSVCGWIYVQNQSKVINSDIPTPVKKLEPRFLDPNQLPAVLDGEPVAYLPAQVPVSIEPLVIASAQKKPVIFEKVVETDQIEKLPTQQPTLEVVEEDPRKVVMNTLVDEGAKMTISSKDMITLKPGFHAKAGAIFQATIDKR